MFSPSPRSLAPLLAAAALPFAAVHAQDVGLPTVQAPPPAAVAPAPAPQAATAAPTFAPQRAVVQNAPPPGPRAEDVARQAQADAARPAPRRARVTPAQAGAATNVRAPAAVRAPSPAAPASAGVTPTVTPTPAATATPPVTATPEVAPEPTPAPVAKETATTTDSGFNPLWAIVGLGALALIGALLFFRRRATDDAVYDDAVYEEPIYTDAPVAVAEPLPVAVAEPYVTADRPQIELGIRPIRAGSENGQARVDYELILENAGAVDARDVTVTSWLLDGAQSSEAEAALIAPMTNQVDVAAGESASVPASASLDRPRGAFRPVVAADARYTLPDGGEGRITARFEVGVDGGEPGRITPIVLDRDELREDLGARLNGEIERV